MTQLNDVKRDLLMTADADESGFDASPKSPGANAAVRALIKAGMLISVPAQGKESRLLITAAGRAAVAPTGEAPAPPQTGESHPPGGTPAAAPAAPATGEPKGKLGTVVTLLRRPQGATIADLTAATQWQAHSVRGAIAGAIKKKLGLPVSSTATEGGRVYRIVEGGVDA